MLRNVELRKLPAGSLCSIAAILETNNDWKRVMALVPRNPRNEYFEPKYNNEHIKQIEDHARASNRKCAEILFEEWGTSGRIRPTLGTLKDVVQEAGIYRAADEIAQMLQEAPPQRPKDGPAAPIDTNVTLMMEQMTLTTEHKLNGTTKQISDPPKPYPSLGNKPTTVVKTDPVTGSQNFPDFSKMMETEDPVAPNNLNGSPFQITFPNVEIVSKGIGTDILQNPVLINFEYRELEAITKKFSEKLIYTPDPVQYKLTGKIGSGGFGEVFVGYHPQHGHLAVKRAFDQKPGLLLKVFNAEVRCLLQLRHKNIVPIVGISKDGPSLCIVCEYIDGGSLEQKLQAKVLSESQRIDIMIGTAEGLRYIHSNEKPPELQDLIGTPAEEDSNNSNNFVHGDVKTANILLTRDCVPKLCDFGLARKYEATQVTIAMGTPAYMAPEGFYGIVTQKNDIYSYGICLLELLTGLKPILVNHEKETVNIKDYIEETCANNEINTVLDPFIDKWTKAKDIYSLAKSCLVKQRKNRPTAEMICDTLYKIKGINKEE